jgi:hypothetical protein
LAIFPDVRHGGRTPQGRSLVLELGLLVGFGAVALRLICSHSSLVTSTSRAWLPLYSPTMPASYIWSISRDARL